MASQRPTAGSTPSVVATCETVVPPHPDAGSTPSVVATCETVVPPDPDEKEEILANLLAELICPICFDLCNPPIITPCGHTTCRNCVDRWLSSGRRTCPSCRAPVRKSQLGRNRVVENVLGVLGYEIRSETIATATTQQSRPHIVRETLLIAIRRARARDEDSHSVFTAQGTVPYRNVLPPPPPPHSQNRLPPPPPTSQSRPRSRTSPEPTENRRAEIYRELMTLDLVRRRSSITGDNDDVSSNEVENRREQDRQRERRRGFHRELMERFDGTAITRLVSSSDGNRHTAHGVTAEDIRLRSQSLGRTGALTLYPPFYGGHPTAV